MARSLMIVGNGMVDQRLAELVTGGSWRVTVLAEEPRPAYDRVHLSDYLAGRSADDLSLVPGGWYNGREHTLLQAEPAVAIDHPHRTVHTAAGRALRYDALVLATGSAPFVRGGRVEVAGT